MTGRDRLVLVGISALAVLAVVWLLLVSPERSKAGKLDTEVSAAGAQLATAESQAADAQQAQQRYDSAYASVVNLGKAVPASEEVPSLMYQLAQASDKKHVDFNSITSGAGSAGASSTSTPATPAAATAGFTQMPFTFVFSGTFSDLYHLFQQLNAATVRTTSGGLQVSGRLLTLQAVKLEPAAAGEPSASEQLTGTITATAYVLPASQGLTAGATAASPASAVGATSASSGSTSTSSSGSSPAPAATIGAVR
ncbi:MAG TPA: type II secretion system protein GspM [Solirubrobacteraceae bacterium]|nr:type II secretion system protein GspM [Solirubrobacteraceae bacterium]